MLLIEKLASAPLPGKVAQETRTLHSELHATRTHLAGPWPGCLIGEFMQARVRDSCITLAGLHWLGTFALWWRRLLHGVTRSDGRAATAQLAGHHLAWLSWSVQILRASDSSVAVVARHAGVTGEPDVRSARTRTITASQL